MYIGLSKFVKKVPSEGSGGTGDECIEEDDIFLGTDDEGQRVFINKKVLK